MGVSNPKVKCPTCMSDNFDFDIQNDMFTTFTCRNCGVLFQQPTATMGSGESDPVNHPSHYIQGGVEVIDVIEAFGLGYRLGNVVKYVLRAGRKVDAVEDLKKARWYLDREIQKREESR